MDFDELAGMVDADEVHAASTHAYRYPSCDRLNVFWDGYEQEPTVYAPDST